MTLIELDKQMFDAMLSLDFDNLEDFDIGAASTVCAEIANQEKISFAIETLEKFEKFYLEKGQSMPEITNEIRLLKSLQK